MFLAPDSYKTNDFELAQLRKVIGASIRERRQALNVSQEEFAFKVGYTQKWVCQLEAGKASVKLEILPRLQEVLQLENPLDLLTRSTLHPTTEIATIQTAINPPKRSQALGAPELRTLAASPS